MPTLESARLKLERAEELLNEIKAEYDQANAAARSRMLAGISDHRIRMAGGELEINPDGTTWYIHRCISVEQPPKRWGLLAGDAMHNTRSALDHLANRLVELEGNRPTNQTAFPLRGAQPTTSSQRRSFEAVIEGMADSHKDAIRRLQPYSMPGTPEAGKLLSLAALDNLDKHTMLLPQVAVIKPENFVPPLFEAIDEGQIEYRLNAGALLAPGVEVLRYRPLSGRHTVTRINFTASLRATYGDPSTGLRELREIRSYVVGIVESFAPEFR